MIKEPIGMKEAYKYATKIMDNSKPMKKLEMPLWGQVRDRIADGYHAGKAG